MSNGSLPTGFFWVGQFRVPQPDTPLRGASWTSRRREFPREVSGCTFRVYYGIADLRRPRRPSTTRTVHSPEQFWRQRPSYGSFTVDAVL